MSWGRFLVSRSIAFIILILILATVLGGVFGVPMGVTYVETDSMEPTLQPGDGFILLPDELTGPPETGDVIVYRAEQLGGGGLTTHRVVDETDRGYITQGDNNDAPDQARDEPPVQPPQIVGQPLQIRGQMVVLPKIGSIITATSDIVITVYATVTLWLGVPDLSSTQLSLVLAGLLALLYIFESFRESSRGDEKSRSTKRRRTRGDSGPYSPRMVLLGLTGLVILATTAVMIVPSGPQQYGVIASHPNSPGLPSPGEQIEFTHGIGNSPVLPMTVFVQGADRVSVTHQRVDLQRGEITNISATISVPPSIGYHQFYVVEHWYLPVLPTGVLTSLYQVHPWLPIAAIDAIVATPYYLIGRYALPRAPDRSRSRSWNQFS